MASALANGLVDAGVAEAGQILAGDPVEAMRKQFQADTGCAATADNAEVARFAEIIILAVKPGYVADVCQKLQSHLNANQLLISIAAGVRLAQLSSYWPAAAGPRLVRVMPNTPCLVGMGAAGYCLGPGATETDSNHVRRLLSCVGTAWEVKEPLLDAVTGLSGSGPAFVYLMIEALADGGVLMGLPREMAQALAAQTVKGAAEMVLQTGSHPGLLKDQVASPGGTTIAGLAALERGGLRAALIDAVQAATARSVQLSQ